MDFDIKRALRAQGEGKALGPHPAFMDRTTPVSVYSPGANRQDAKISQRDAGRHAQAYGGSEAIDWVYDAVNLYADSTAVATWHLERRDGTQLVRTRGRGTPPDHEIGPSDLYDLLDRPNPFMLYDELVSLLVIDLLLVGNGYWLRWRTTSDGRPLALYRLSPMHVRIIPGPFGPKRYEYQPPGVREPLRIDPRDLMHFRLPNPHDAYYGMGVIRGGGRPLDLEIALADTQASYYENRADPSLIIQSDRRIPRDVFAKLRAQLRTRLTGSRRSGELLVLEAGLRASTLTPSAREALFDILTRLSRDRVLAMFRVNPKLLGIMDETGGSDRISDARVEYDTYVLRPFMDRLQRRISDGLTAAWGINFRIDYRATMAISDLLRDIGTLAALPGIKVREIRRQLAPLGIEESTGDPEIDEMVLNQPGEELDANGQNGSPDRPLPGEPGRPPLGRNTRAITRSSPTNRNSAVAAGKALEELTQRLSLVELRAQLEGKAFEQAGRTSIGNKLPDEQRPDDVHHDARSSDLDAARDFLRAELITATQTLERSLLDHVEGKAFKPNNVTGRVRNSPAWRTFREAVERALIEGVKRSIQSAAMHQAALGRAPEEELDYDTIAKTVVHRRGGLSGIVATLRSRISAAVRDEAHSDSPVQSAVQAAVQTTLRDWREGSAETISLTEAVHGYNEGTLTVAELTGATEVYVTDGHDTDEPCVEANGQVWAIEKARDNRLEHPNCRRAFLPLGTVTS